MVGLYANGGQFVLRPVLKDGLGMLDSVNGDATRATDGFVGIGYPHIVTPYLALLYLKGDSAKAAYT